MTLNCFQSEDVTVRDKLQEKVAEMESFAGHLEEIFLTVEVNVTFKRLTLTGQCEHLKHFFYCFIEVQDVRFHFCNWIQSTCVHLKGLTSRIIHCFSDPSSSPHFFFFSPHILFNA